MVDPPTPFHHLRCQQVGSVTIAVVGQAAFAESSHPDDWTPHLTDAVTNRELRDDLTRLAAVSPGPVVIDMRGVNMFLGDAVARLIIFARQMAEEGKPLVVCASPSIVTIINICAGTDRMPVSSDLDAAIARARAATPGAESDSPGA